MSLFHFSYDSIKHISFIQCWRTSKLISKLAMVTCFVMDKDMQVPLWYIDLESFCFMPKSRMSGLCLGFVRKLHIVFHSDCTLLESHQQEIRHPFTCVLHHLHWCISSWQPSELTWMASQRSFHFHSPLDLGYWRFFNLLSYFFF